MINFIVVVFWFGICMIIFVIFCLDVVYYGLIFLEIKEDWEDLEISELLVCIVICLDYLIIFYIGYGKIRLRVIFIEIRLWYLLFLIYVWLKFWKRVNISFFFRVDILISSMDY